MQITNIRRGKEDITTDLKDIQDKRVYCEQLYANILDNLDEMDTFIEIHTLLKIDSRRNRNLNRPLAMKEIEFMFNNFQKETPDPDDFTSEFHTTFKKEIIPILHILLQKIEIHQIIL